MQHAFFLCDFSCFYFAVAVVVAVVVLPLDAPCSVLPFRKNGRTTLHTGRTAEQQQHTGRTTTCFLTPFSLVA
jgi:hypothetical protein